MLTKFQTSVLASKIFAKVGGVAKSGNPDEARKMARKSTKDIYETLLPDLGINVSIKFSETSKKKFPEEFEALQNYIKTGEISENIPLLFLGNHQAFGFEAIGAYNIIPTNSRILLKDTLAKIPYFGKGIKALDPIIFDRKLGLTKESTKRRNSEIKDTILSSRAVLIYPEGTRSRDGSLGELYQALYSSAVKTIQTTNEISNKVASIITSDTNNIFPDTLEKSLVFGSNARRGEINFIIDFIDLSTFQTMKEINETVRDIITNNLSKKKI